MTFQPFSCAPKNSERDPVHIPGGSFVQCTIKKIVDAMLAVRTLREYTLKPKSSQLVTLARFHYKILQRLYVFRILNRASRVVTPISIVTRSFPVWHHHHTIFNQTNKQISS